MIQPVDAELGHELAGSTTSSRSPSIALTSSPPSTIAESSFLQPPRRSDFRGLCDQRGSPEPTLIRYFHPSTAHAEQPLHHQHHSTHGSKKHHLYSRFKRVRFCPDPHDDRYAVASHHDDARCGHLRRVTVSNSSSNAPCIPMTRVHAAASSDRTRRDFIHLLQRIFDGHCRGVEWALRQARPSVVARQSIPHAWCGETYRRS